MKQSKYIYLSDQWNKSGQLSCSMRTILDGLHSHVWQDPLCLSIDRLSSSSINIDTYILTYSGTTFSKIYGRTYFRFYGFYTFRKKLAFGKVHYYESCFHMIKYFLNIWNISQLNDSRQLAKFNWQQPGVGPWLHQLYNAMKSLQGGQKKRQSFFNIDSWQTFNFGFTTKLAIFYNPLQFVFLSP